MSKAEQSAYAVDEARMTEPVLETWRRLQRLGLKPAQIHAALEPVVALLNHLQKTAKPTSSTRLVRARVG